MEHSLLIWVMVCVSSYDNHRQRGNVTITSQKNCFMSAKIHSNEDIGAGKDEIHDQTLYKPIVTPFPSLNLPLPLSRLVLSLNRKAS